MNEKSGGPAFPFAPALHGGMSLRDYFAAQAMRGFMASPSTASEVTMDDEKCAAWSYQMADAMLVERDK